MAPVKYLTSRQEGNVLFFCFCRVLRRFFTHLVHLASGRGQRYSWQETRLGGDNVSGGNELICHTIQALPTTCPNKTSSYRLRSPVSGGGWGQGDWAGTDVGAGRGRGWGWAGGGVGQGWRWGGGGLKTPRPHSKPARSHHSHFDCLPKWSSVRPSAAPATAKLRRKG